MNPLEGRLVGRDATVAGIVRFIDRQAARAPLSRVEIRYSTQAAVRLDPRQARAAVSELLVEHGQTDVSISVRAQESPLDDASGEHRVRLVSSAPRKSPIGLDPPGTASLALWRRWLNPWLQKARSAPAPIGRPVAVAMLRGAVDRAAAQTLKARSGVIGEARIVVRVQALHDVLGPIVDANPQAASQSIGALLSARGIALETPFTVRYCFQPQHEGDGTGHASESELAVTLRSRAGRRSDAPLASESPAIADPPCEADAADDPGTALPGPSGAALVVQVTGTTDAPFAEPFLLTWASLPARFDRDTLRRAGFEARHPGLSSVASNTCPLVIESAPEGGWRVRAGTRRLSDRDSAPMYFRADSRAGLVGQETLQEGTRLIVNCPEGAHDRATGARLPALLIVLQRRYRITSGQ